MEGPALGELASEWRELARRSARSPFESPDWLLPWARHYGLTWQPIAVTWWRGSRLAAVAPIAMPRRLGRRMAPRELSFWGWTGTPIRGWIDVVADPDVADEVAIDFASWLRDGPRSWDLFHYLHLPAESPTLSALARASRSWWRVDLSFALHSLEYVVPLPEDASGWRGQLGPKARHEIRRELRLFERRHGGQIERVDQPASCGEIVDTLECLLAARWGEREAYFRRDPRFRGFIGDAVEQAMLSGLGWALVARDRDGSAACLLMLSLGGTAVATLLGVSQAERYRPLSLGKCLFARALDEAVEAGCRTFSFLAEDGYKTAYWHAQGRPTRSGFFGRGAVGGVVAAYATARRVAPQRLRDLATGRRLEYRP